MRYVDSYQQAHKAQQSSNPEERRAAAQYFARRNLAAAAQEGMPLNPNGYTARLAEGKADPDCQACKDCSCSSVHGSE